MWVLRQIRDGVNGTEGDSSCLQLADKQCSFQHTKDTLDDVIQCKPVFTARCVGIETWVKRKLSIIEQLVTEALPLTLILYRYHHLLSALAGIDAVGRDGGMVKANASWRHSTFLMQ